MPITNIILILFLTLVGMQVSIILYFHRYLRKSRDIQIAAMVKHLHELDEGTKSHLASLNIHTKEVTDAIRNTVNKVAVDNKSVLLLHQNTIKTFTKKLQVDYNQYISSVSRTNLNFEKIIEQLQGNLSNFNQMREVLFQNDLKLEFVSDSTIELIADNKKVILDFQERNKDFFEHLDQKEMDGLTIVTSEEEPLKKDT